MEQTKRGEMQEGNTFDIEGVGHVYAWGNPEKPLVILLHGFMQTGRSWQQVAMLLKQHYVLAPDLLGHGQTPFKQGDCLSLENYVQQLSTLIAWAKNNDLSGKTDEVGLVGYSLGGRIAALYATRYPEGISALVLESAGLGPCTEEERAMRAQKTQSMIEKLNRSVALDPNAPLSAFVDYWEELPLFESQTELPELQRLRIRAERLANNPVALRQNLENAGQHRMDDLRPALANLNKPLLYLVGERDVAYTEIARSLMRAWAYEQKTTSPFDQGFVQVKVVPRVGHNIHLEDPEEYARLVDGFLLRAR